MLPKSTRNLTGHAVRLRPRLAQTLAVVAAGVTVGALAAAVPATAVPPRRPAARYGRRLRLKASISAPRSPGT